MRYTKFDGFKETPKIAYRDQLSNSVDDLVESLEILTLLLDAALKKAAKEDSDD